MGEARFEPNSYGFRPGRSCQDAIDAIFNSIRYKAKYVLDADIAKCFDRINHEALLKKVNTSPKMRQVIKKWLKSGYVDNQGTLFTSTEGTPQGGTISPLLANIALHGMEERIMKFADQLKGGKRDNRKSLSLIRYADDFVILHEDKAIVQECQKVIEDWLKDMGLELKPSKTKITHTLNKKGFDFLGYHIQQHKVGNYRSAKNPRKTKLGFNTLITPAKKEAQRHYKNIAEVIERHKTAPQGALISRLNPIIRGWSNYYSAVVSKETFSKLDCLVYNKLRAWARYRGKGSINKDKYWRTVENKNWCFSTEDGITLRTHSETPIIRHTKVKGEVSPYNGDWNYWSKRRGEYPGTPTRVAKLIKKQKGKCPHCGLHFTSEDLLEVDHIVPKSKGGKDTYHNLQLLHRHCHDTKTASDGSFHKNQKDEI